MARSRRPHRTTGGRDARLGYTLCVGNLFVLALAFFAVCPVSAAPADVLLSSILSKGSGGLPGNAVSNHDLLGTWYDVRGFLCWIFYFRGVLVCRCQVPPRLTRASPLVTVQDFCRQPYQRCFARLPDWL